MVLALVFLLLPTRWLQEANPVWRLTCWALALEAVGLTLGALVLRGGWAWGRFFLFPVAFFLVAVPWPTDLELGVTQPLMRANVAVTTELLWLKGIPAIQEGNVIRLSRGLVGIDEACSGIRSLQTGLVISLFLGEFYRLALARRLLLCVAGFALTFVFNVGRTFLLSVVGAREGPAGIARWHDPAGIGILLGCCLGLWLLSLSLRRRESGRSEARSPAVPCSSPSSQVRDPGSILGTLRAPLGLFSVGFGIWLVLVEAATEAWYRAHEQPARSEPAWGLRWPPARPGFQTVELSQMEQAILACDEKASGAWTEGDGSHWQINYFRWIPSRSLSKRMTVNLMKCHAPDTCLVASGKTLRANLGMVLVQRNDYTFPFQKMVFDDHGRTLYVFYGVFEDLRDFGGLWVNRRRNASERISAALAGSRNFGQRMMEVAVWGYADSRQAEAAFLRQMESLIQIGP